MTTNAERQRAHRQRQRADNRPLNTWLTSETHHALKRLAVAHNTSQRATLEQLIMNADETLRQSLDDEAFDAYLDGTLRSNGNGSSE